MIRTSYNTNINRNFENDSPVKYWNFQNFFNIHNVMRKKIIPPTHRNN